MVIVYQARPFLQRVGKGRRIWSIDYMHFMARSLLQEQESPRVKSCVIIFSLPLINYGWRLGVAISACHNIRLGIGPEGKRPATPRGGFWVIFFFICLVCWSIKQKNTEYVTIHVHTL